MAKVSDIACIEYTMLYYYLCPLGNPPTDSLLEELGSHRAEPPWETCRNHQFRGRVIVPHEFAITPIQLMKTTLQNRHLLHALNYQLVITHKQHANVLTSGHCEVHRKR